MDAKEMALLVKFPAIEVIDLNYVKSDQAIIKEFLKTYLDAGVGRFPLFLNTEEQKLITDYIQGNPIAKEKADFLMEDILPDALKTFIKKKDDKFVTSNPTTKGFYEKLQNNRNVVYPQENRAMVEKLREKEGKIRRKVYDELYEKFNENFHTMLNSLCHSGFNGKKDENDLLRFFHFAGMNDKKIDLFHQVFDDFKKLMNSTKEGEGKKINECLKFLNAIWDSNNMGKLVHPDKDIVEINTLLKNVTELAPTCIK